MSSAIKAGYRNGPFIISNGKNQYFQIIKVNANGQYYQIPILQYSISTIVNFVCNVG